MDDLEKTIVAEHTHEFEEVPVCVHVLETEEGLFAVGYSVSSRAKFNVDVARSFSRSRALATLRLLRSKTR